MTDRVATVLVDVRVQALEIVVEDLFVPFHVSVDVFSQSRATWTTERLNESSISNCSLEFNILLRLYNNV